MKTAGAKIVFNTFHLQKKESRPFFTKGERGSFFSKHDTASKSSLNSKKACPKFDDDRSCKKYKFETNVAPEAVVPKLNTNSSTDSYIHRQTEDTDPVYRGCTSENTNVSNVSENLNNAINLSRVMINDATSLLNRIQAGNASQEVNTLFHQKFGPVRTAAIRIIIRNYTLILRRIDSDRIRRGHGIVCVPMGRGRCTTREREGMILRVGGFTICDSNRPVYLCAQSLNDVNEIANTLIHEIAHNIGICPSNSAGELYEHDSNFPLRNSVSHSADSYSSFARESQVIRGGERVQEQEAEAGGAAPNFEIAPGF